MLQLRHWLPKVWNSSYGVIHGAFDGEIVHVNVDVQGEWHNGRNDESNHQHNESESHEFYVTLKIWFFNVEEDQFLHFFSLVWIFF